MAEVRKAVREDIPAILNLLSELNPAIQNDKWQRCFRSEFKSDVQPGIVIDDNGEIGAFLGTIIVNRSYRDWNYTSCNIWGWVVREPYRSQSLQMLNEVLQWPYVLTCYSPMELTYKILTRFGFMELRKDLQIVSSGKRSGPSRPGISNVVEIDSKAEPEERRIIEFHSGLECRMFWLSEKSRRTLLVFKSEVYKSKLIQRIRMLPFLGNLLKIRLYKLEFVSDPGFFESKLSDCLFRLLIRLKTPGIIFPKALLISGGLTSFRPYYGTRKYLWRGVKGMPEDFTPDALFSELVILGLPG